MNLQQGWDRCGTSGEGKHEDFSGWPGDHCVPPGKGSGYDHTSRAAAHFPPATNKQGKEKLTEKLRELFASVCGGEDLLLRSRLQKSEEEKHSGLDVAGERPKPWPVRSRPQKRPLGPRCRMSETNCFPCTASQRQQALSAPGARSISKPGSARSLWLLVRVGGKSDPLPPAVERTPHLLGPRSPVPQGLPAVRPELPSPRDTVTPLGWLHLCWGLWGLGPKVRPIVSSRKEWAVPLAALCSDLNRLWNKGRCSLSTFHKTGHRPTIT